MANKIYFSEMDVFIKLSNPEYFPLGKIIVKEYLKSQEMEELGNNIERTCFNFVQIYKNELIALFHTHFYSGETEDILIPIKFCIDKFFEEYKNES